MGPSAKRRKLASQVEEVNFDDTARHEFLTGFRKRKQQRARHAQGVAEKRLREDARKEKKRIREERTAEFQRALEEHRHRLRKINEGSESEGDDPKEEAAEEEEEWEGFEEPPAVDYEAEYIDEDKYTTVTVEEMDPSREGLLKFGKADNPDDSEDEQPGKPEDDDANAAFKSKTKSTDKKKVEKPKKKKKKFRYESKEDRKTNEMKVRLSNKKKAAARRER